MKTKKLTPRNVAPVKRQNVANVSNEGNAITPATSWPGTAFSSNPFAGDDAE